MASALEGNFERHTTSFSRASYTAHLRWAIIAPPGVPFNPPLAKLSARMDRRAEVAELEDALDSKSSGAMPRAGSTPAFGIRLSLVAGLSTKKTTNKRRS